MPRSETMVRATKCGLGILFAGLALADAFMALAEFQHFGDMRVAWAANSVVAAIF